MDAAPRKGAGSLTLANAGRTVEATQPSPIASEHDVTATSFEGGDAPAAGDISSEGITGVARRVTVRGKFLFDGPDKFWIRGVTYGTFAQSEDGANLPSPEMVDADFAAMAAVGFNAVRVYTLPPRWMLDCAGRHGLRVMVGMPWEQHIAFLDESGRADAIRRRLAADLAPIAGHPAILCYAVGNEIPAAVVRWHGKRRIEQFLATLAGLIKAADPGALVTYVNFPTTEYLDQAFADFLSFNVYLEDRETLAKYLARLQNIACERPLVMAEIGLDSRRNGEEKQAEVLDWQVRTAFEAGCAGSFVFAWTDEWHRGGNEILDWDFGLVTRDREPKPALAAVAEAFADAPFGPREWPLISVVVCSYNGSGTIEETLRELCANPYPSKQIIVINDGSTDAVPEIAARYPVELTSTENRGLSAARTLGMDQSRGEIIVYIDDDAYPDEHWLFFLAHAFATQDVGAVGGPNIGPPEDGDIAECVANAPGGPIHVLVSDQVAEHIPGCNMAYRADALRKIGGFDPQFRVAGDDVDCCWRLMDSGETIGFHPAAMVWHHRRPSISRYLKQQRGYARAEALLEVKWPDKYNSTGHLSWHGRLYGRGLMEIPFLKSRIYHGTWNSAPFQSIYQPAAGLFASLPLMPEWFAILAGLAVIGLLGIDWPPLLFFGALALAGLGLSVFMAWQGARRAQFSSVEGGRRPDWQMRAIVMWLHLLQPVARLIGRIQHGIGPWHRSGLRLLPLPVAREKRLWREDDWQSLEDRIGQVEQAMRRLTLPCRAGHATDRYDLAFRQSAFGEVRVLGMVEEHGSGKQLFRFASHPVVFRGSVMLLALLAVLCAGSFVSGAEVAGSVLAALAALVALECWSACAKGAWLWQRGFAEAFPEPAGKTG